MIGPSSHSHPLDSFSDNILKPAYIVEANSWIWFFGYLEFHDLAGKRYESGFLHVLRQDAKGLGLHLALPEDNAEQYNYHRTLDD